MAIFDYELVNRSNSVTEVDRLKQKFVGNPKVEKGIFEDGLSRFQLNTFDGDTEIINTGLLEEMPEFSFSVDYTDGPGTLWQDMLQEFMENDLFNIINAIGAANTGGSWKNILQGGSWTKKVYNGYNPGSISLKFKVFKDNNLGQTSAIDWINHLNTYAAISNKNLFSFDQALTNIESGLGNVKGSTQQLVQEFMKFMNKNNEKKEKKDDRTADEKKQEEARQKKAEFQNYIDDLNEIFFNKEHDIYMKDKKQLHQTKRFKIWIELTKDDAGATDVFQLFAEIYGSFGAKVDDTTTGEAKTDKYKGYSIENFEQAFNELLDEIKDEMNRITTTDAVKDAVKNEYEKCQEIINEKKTEKPPPSDNITRQIDRLAEFKTIVNKGSDVLSTAIKKYGPTRVADTFNRQNSFGAKLWYLHIYSGTIFKKTTPLIVYISDWSVKRSEESVGITPYYYEFNITCNLDQTYSRAQWFRVLESDITKDPDNTKGTFWGNIKNSNQMKI